MKADEEISGSAAGRPQVTAGRPEGLRVSVIGAGYLGATHAACMAELGHHVVAIDSSPEHAAVLAGGAAPFYEPGLDDLLARHSRSGALAFGGLDAMPVADVHFLCVPTPQEPHGLRCDLGPLRRAVRWLAPHLRDGDVVVGKSTVPVGTAAMLARQLRLLRPDIEVSLCWNPEFLREGHAVEDTLRPSRLVVGVSPEDGRAAAALRRLYAEVIASGAPLLVTDLATAELMKAAANAFLATKISFINAMSQLCDSAGADVVTLAAGLGLDPRIGSGALGPGLGYGGGCLPKDLHALQARAQELGVGDSVAFLADVDAVNAAARQRVLDIAEARTGGLRGARIGVLGAAFKAGSDDIRESPALAVITALADAGAHVQVFDPRAARRAAEAEPRADYASDPWAVLAGASLVMLLTDWPEFAAIDPARAASVVAEPTLIDARHVVDRAAWAARGWTVIAPGRPTLSPDRESPDHEGEGRAAPPRPLGSAGAHRARVGGR